MEKPVAIYDLIAMLQARLGYSLAVKRGLKDVKYIKNERER